MTFFDLCMDTLDWPKGFRTAAARENIRDRILSSIRIDRTSGCWLWTKSLNTGYGQIRVGPSIALAHRASYMVFLGPIPRGLEACHKCDTPACVNPEHIFIGTHAENMADSKWKGRISRGDRHKRAITKASGDSKGNTKLTSNDVRAILRAIEDGASSYALARAFNVSATAIYHIKHRKTWRHIDEGEGKSNDHH